MSGRWYPESPYFRSDGERRVFEAMAPRLRDVDVLIVGQRFSDRDGDWEVDAILLMPEGFVSIEIKGGRVSRADGAWWQQTRDGRKQIDLEDQAVRGKHLVKRWLTRQPTWAFGSPRMAHLVVFPDTTLGPEDPSPGLPRDWIIDKTQVADTVGRAWDLISGQLHQEPVAAPGIAAVEAAADLLCGRGDPQQEIAESVTYRDDHADRLTEGQFTLLSTASAISAYHVRGGPGTGKTWLAVEQARRWATQGRRVAFVCYSRGLSTWVQRRIASIGRDAERIWAGTFHSLGVHWGGAIEEGAGPEFWEGRFPLTMLALARGLSEDDMFDALVVDEAQDFDDSWWPPLLTALRPDARVAVFGDDRQSVFGRRGAPDIALTQLLLDTNMRNTREVAHVFIPLADPKPILTGASGPPVRFIACRDETALTTADDAAVGLLDEGWQSSQVALLTTNHRHPMQRMATEPPGTLTSYWEQFWTGDDIFYATVPGFKGLERPAVVLAVDGFRDMEVARSVLYVGLSRARDLLVVCADPRTIRQVAGDSVADRLLALQHSTNR
jgi:hypothetical protein